MDIDKLINTNRWTVTNRTNIPLSYPITGVGFSPVREHCIVVYVKLPEEIEHLHLPVRTKILDALKVNEPSEAYEEDYPLILVNKIYNTRTMADMMKFSFFRNFRNTARKAGVDVMNPYSARHLIGKKIETKFIQMRKLNTDIKFWAVDRVGIVLK